MRSYILVPVVAACLVACTGTPTKAPGTTPSPGPASASPSTGTPAASGVTYDRLTLKVDGQEKSVARVGSRNQSSGILTFTLGNAQGQVVPAGAYAISIMTAAQTDAEVKPGAVSFNVIAGNGQPLSTQYTNGSLDGTPTVDTVSAANGKLSLRFQGRLKCGMCEDTAGAPPKAADIDLTIDGLVLR